VQLLGEEDDDDEGEGKGYGSLGAAVRTILIADLVMSLDNVIAVAAAAQGSTTLLVIGLAISIPLVIFGSTLMIKLMERFPIIVVLGAALIGWVGGETIVNDAILRDFAEANGWVHYAAALAGALFVVAVGKALRAHARAKESVVSRDPAASMRP
jgi:predicted tellurium resistance membrane protein TerC